jgi:hypothetical protein
VFDKGVILCKADDDVLEEDVIALGRGVFNFPIGVLVLAAGVIWPSEDAVVLEAGDGAVSSGVDGPETGDVVVKISGRSGALMRAFLVLLLIVNNGRVREECLRVKQVEFFLHSRQELPTYVCWRLMLRLLLCGITYQFKEITITQCMYARQQSTASFVTNSKP